METQERPPPEPEATEPAPLALRLLAELGAGLLTGATLFGVVMAAGFASENLGVLILGGLVAGISSIFVVPAALDAAGKALGSEGTYGSTVLGYIIGALAGFAIVALWSDSIVGRTSTEQDALMGTTPVALAVGGAMLGHELSGLDGRDVRAELEPHLYPLEKKSGGAPPRAINAPPPGRCRSRECPRGCRRRSPPATGYSDR